MTAREVLAKSLNRGEERTDAGLYLPAKAASQGPESNGLSFEQAIQRLEKIVADMEGAELPLEDVLKKYEEGTRLVRFCSQKLEEAEKALPLPPATDADPEAPQELSVMLFGATLTG